MKRLNGRAMFVAATVFAASAVHAENLAGTYVAADGTSTTMTLTESPDGVIAGTLADPGMSQPVNAKRQGAGLAGTIGRAGNRLPFTATLRGKQLTLQVGAPGETERLTLTRTGASTASSAPPPTPAAHAQRNVVINGQRLSDAEVARIEQAYRVRIGDANYWYDYVLGAWGLTGGPAAGFIAPGLRLGGALRPDASGRGTRIFVNGRELHPDDVRVLQQITGPILPGRYFITGQGLAGYEGGPPTWNLAAMAAQAQSSGSGSHSWQGRLSSGFSDGTTGAVFLPNGGIVSTGR